MTTRILVIGAGFSGMWSALGAVRLLEKEGRDDVEVALVAPEASLHGCLGDVIYRIPGLVPACGGDHDRLWKWTDFTGVDGVFPEAGTCATGGDGKRITQHGPAVFFSTGDQYFWYSVLCDVSISGSNTCDGLVCPAPDSVSGGGCAHYRKWAATDPPF